MNTSPPNPTKLLNNNQIDKFITKTTQEYDHILFDSPPINTITNTIILTNQIDKILLITKYGHTTTETLHHTTNTLQSITTPLINIILNDLQETHLNYYQHNYYHKKYYSLNDKKQQQQNKKPPLEIIKS